ncbi:tyrosine-type recombinase/integrase [Bradyrhizobium betae]|uniref:Tyrosine-type recombinase/integrase n=2 Tax=Bradyrhizobium betae TaxID=244734 RepID=A0A5P6PEH2_9BRAD|nr:tyrosine-type recombinase/integrase [Bradyrhizobium betae]
MDILFCKVRMRHGFPLEPASTDARRVRPEVDAWRVLLLKKEPCPILRRRGAITRRRFAPTRPSPTRAAAAPGRLAPERRSGIQLPVRASVVQAAHLDEGYFQRAHLRLTTGMRTLRKTHNLPMVQELLGHTDIKTTAMFYTAATVDDVRQAMEETWAHERQRGSQS